MNCSMGENTDWQPS